ncbi:MAG: VOC family protein, partial [Lachnospiraceae bacterium]|nr:VOC family protein [Lachnospiraceae bacterium]
KGSIKVPMFHGAKSATLIVGNAKETFKKKDLLYDVQFSNVAAEIRKGQVEGGFVTSENTVDVMEILDECRRQMGVIYPQEKDLSDERLNGAKVTAISHVGFNVKDLEESIRFYCDILGCKEKFTLTYGDMAEDIKRESASLGKDAPFYANILGKNPDRKWSVYVQLPGCQSFIELFDQMGVKKRKAATNMDMGFTHFSLEVNDIYAYRDRIILNGGRKYIDTDIKLGLDNTLQMWMRDPDDNLFEIMEYTEKSYQVVGR